MSQPQITERSLTPREIVTELDRYIVGQKAAKRAVAVALRNRWRRRRVDADLKDEITPKNIILIGPTGVGKTEIARRLARLVSAPFVKVEASKFTEVGYVGRDVDSMVRDLVETSVQMVREEEKTRVLERARAAAQERLLDLLLPRPAYEKAATPAPNSNDPGRDKLRQMLIDGDLAGREVEIDAEDKQMPMFQLFSNSGMEEMGLQLQDMMGQMGGKRTRKRRVKIPEALAQLTSDEAQKLVDQDLVVREGLRRAQEDGIIFLDEIDKIARRQGPSSGPDVSREGVQRDILPIVEGSQVTTKYGVVRTDHVLFIAAGAFHIAKVSDLIPELQGRFPVRVELESLGEAELLRILQEPQNSLPRQYAALLATEEVELVFEADGLKEIARIATEANQKSENIGARRLHTVLERLLESIAFEAPEARGARVVVNGPYVRDALKDTLAQDDLARYVL